VQALFENKGLHPHVDVYEDKGDNGVVTLFTTDTIPKDQPLLSVGGICCRFCTQLCLL
jgi:hypothetical protein